ncbi:MAG: hypothetical protein ABR518_03285 [Actinomycetota bacterium]
MFAPEPAPTEARPAPLPADTESRTLAPAPPVPVTAPPGREDRRRRAVLTAVAVLVAAAVIGGIVYLLTRDGTDTTATPTPTGITTTAPTTPATSPAPVTSDDEAFPGTAQADAASLQVVPLGPRDEKCNTNTYGGTSAYLSDCTDWGNQQDTLFFFYVTFENRTSDTLSWKRSSFSVTTGSETLGPVEVRDEAAAPTTFLPKSGNIPAQGSISGYLVFETDGSFDPDGLQYERGDLSLIIRFEGPKEVVRRG